MSSGKKQGEMLCFDLAYTMFSASEGIPSLKFLLNDKKELMSDNQLISACEFVKDKKIQLIMSILKDKVPEEVLHNSRIIAELSTESKLFNIEQSSWFEDYKPM